jgi:hypothetical protein
MLTFFLLTSEQVFAHNNHSFFNEQSTRFEQSFLDEQAVTVNTTVENRSPTKMVGEQLSDIALQQAQRYISLLLKKRIVFPNHILLNQLRQKQHKDKQADDDCNCLNDCSCLDCQCANCPMATACHGISVALLHDIIVFAQPIHENLVFTTITYFISQPHANLYRPPITL